MFEYGQWKVREGARKVRIKFKVNQSPGCGFLSVLKVGISQPPESGSDLSLVTLLWNNQYNEQ